MEKHDRDWEITADMVSDNGERSIVRRVFCDYTVKVVEGVLFATQTGKYIPDLILAPGVWRAVERVAAQRPKAETEDSPLDQFKAAGADLPVMTIDPPPPTEVEVAPPTPLPEPDAGWTGRTERAGGKADPDNTHTYDERRDVVQDAVDAIGAKAVERVETIIGEGADQPDSPIAVEHVVEEGDAKLTVNVTLKRKEPDRKPGFADVAEGRAISVNLKRKEPTVEAELYDPPPTEERRDWKNRFGTKTQGT